MSLIFFCMIAGSASAVTGSDWLLGNQHAGFPARSDHTSVIFNEKMWIIGGTNGLTIRNDTWSSSDGVTWTLVNASAEFPARSDAASIVFNNRIWIIGGTSATGSLNDTWSSTDGEIWTLANASAEFQARTHHTAIVYNNKMWVTGGWTTTYTNDTWSSSDGDVWIQTNASAEFPARQRHATVVFDNSLWTIGGFDGTYYNDTWKSDDGNIWTLINASAAFPTRSDHTATAFNDKMWIIGGQELSGMRNDTWYSANGNIWTLANASPAFPARNSHTSVVFENDLWILGGADSSDYYNDTWYTKGPSDPVPVPQSDSGSDSTGPTVQSSVKGISHAGDPVTFTFGNALSPTNPVRIEAVTVIPAQSTTGEILCIVKDASRGNYPIPNGLVVAGYADINLVWIRDDAIREGTVLFSIDTDWLNKQHINPSRIVMLRFADGKWNELSTMSEYEDNKRNYFTASMPGFSLFAIAVKPLDKFSSQTNPPISPSQTTIPVTAGTTVNSLTKVISHSPPQPITTTVALPLPGTTVPDKEVSLDPIFVLIAAILIGISAFLVRRWWIHRQNPALFKK